MAFVPATLMGIRYYRDVPCSNAILFAALLSTAACGGGSSDVVDGAPGSADSSVPDDVRPGKRSDVTGVANPATGTIALFGGDNGPIVNQTPSPAYVDDTWVFSPTTGWSEISASGPSARGRHAVAFDPNGGRMLVFGGRFRAAGTTGNYTLYNDLWAFEFASGTWAMLHDGSGTAPSRRYFAAAAYDADSSTFYLYGGGTNAAPLSISVATDVWAFDGANWSQVTVTGTAPSSRLFVSYAHDTSRDRLIAFGGQIGDFQTPAMNDLYALDLGTGVWSQLHDGSGTAPRGRFSGMMTYDASGDRYLLMGGHADPGVTNDVWAFDPDGGGWSQLSTGDTFTGAALGCLNNPREIPEGYVVEDLTSPERRAGGVFAILGGSLYVFGGESDCSDHLDDVWSLNLTDATWSELIGARSGESCARRNDDCTCLCL